MQTFLVPSSRFGLLYGSWEARQLEELRNISTGLCTSKRRDENPDKSGTFFIFIPDKQKLISYKRGDESFVLEQACVFIWQVQNIRKYAADSGGQKGVGMIRVGAGLCCFLGQKGEKKACRSHEREKDYKLWDEHRSTQDLYGLRRVFVEIRRAMRSPKD